MSSHSSIGASSAHRWLACPASIKLCEDAPLSRTSKYALEGTKAHEVAELLLLGKPIPLWADEAMIAGAKMYSQAITERMLDHDEVIHPLHLESKVAIPSLDARAFGTCDAWFVGGTTLYVIDYKYGAGLSVSPVENYQLLYYAAGVIETFLKDTTITKIVLVIVQPRCGGVSEWECGLDVIEHFLFTAQCALVESKEVNPIIKAGDHCKWCPAQATCPAKRAEIESLFDVKLDEPRINKETPQDVDVADLVRYIDHAETIQSWLKALKYHAQSLIEMGCDVPGYAVEQGLSNRAWKSLADVELHLSNQYGDAVFNKSLKSPAQIEKIKGVDKKLIAELTERKPTEKKLVKTDGGVNSGLFTAFTEEG